MKTRYFNRRWLGALLAIALAGGGCLVATTYIKLEKRIQSEQACAAMLERLAADQKISAALRSIRDGDVRAGARRLDLLLCDDILQAKAELAAADGRAQASAKQAWAQIARSRPSNAEIGGSGSGEVSSDQIAAERILARAAPDAGIAQAGLAAKH
jgi:hypothetical protein